MPSCCSPPEGLSCKSPHFAGQPLYRSRTRGAVFGCPRAVLRTRYYLASPVFRGPNSSLLPHSRDSILMPSCCSPHEVLSCKSPHFAGQILHCPRMRGKVFWCPRVVLRTGHHRASPRISRGKLFIVPAFAGQYSVDVLVLFSARGTIVQVPALRGANSSLLPHSRDSNSIPIPSWCSPHEVLSCKSPHFVGQILHWSRIRGTVF